ncbi:MAG: hypothetical protein ABI352_04925 [Candidatus Dormibacter sp.]
MTRKRRTTQNIVVGGAAGAVPVLVGSVIATLRAILAYAVVLVAVSLLPAFTLGARYAVPVTALDAYLLFLAARALQRRTVRSSARLFHYSLLYLAAVCACGAVAALVVGG